MMTLTRHDIEILLDSPEQTDYVVSAYADLRVKDGFRHYAGAIARDQGRQAGAAMGNSEARKALAANLDAIHRAIDAAAPAARGLAVFSGAGRGLFHAVELDFPVENYLVVDEDPFVLPLLERWHGAPAYLVAVVDSKHLQLFEAHAGVAEEVGGLDREIDASTQRDKPRFTYKKRFAQTQHERLRTLDEDTFLKEVAAQLVARWKAGHFGGLILLGQSQVTAAVRRLLPREVDEAVVAERSQPMTDRADDVSDDVAQALDRWRAEQRGRLVGELEQRWKEDHLVANGPTAVLDALQQGRAVEVVVGPRRDLDGAVCKACRYRFGAPVRVCVYCQGDCRTVNAIQEILRMALRHRVPIHLLERNGADPVARAGGVAALLRAGANWAPKEPAPARLG